MIWVAPRRQGESAMSNGVVFCQDCGSPIEGEPPTADDPTQRPPCPRCGSTARRFDLPAATVRIAMTLGSTTLTVTPYEDALLSKAQELITAGNYDVATVVAHMACEIGAERAISQAFTAKGVADLEESVSAFFSGYNLGTPRIRDLYNALTGRRIQDQPFWQAFVESATRRNRAVHKGSTITAVQAAASLQAARDLVAYLK